MECIVCQSKFTLKRRSRKRTNKFCSLGCYWKMKKGERPVHLIGYIHSEETKKKIRQAVAIHPSRGYTGKKHSLDAKKKMRIAKLGKPLSETHRKKLSVLLRIAYKEGRRRTWFGTKDSWNKGMKGIHFSRMSEWKKGNIPWNKHKRTKLRPWNKIGDGITPLMEKIRKCFEYKQWRRRIYERDNWSCVLCGIRGGRLHSDHYPDTFSLIIHRNRVTSLEKARSCKELWNINNGRTLCYPCHRKTDTWGYQAVKT